jgi:hypothetical protein
MFYGDPPERAYGSEPEIEILQYISETLINSGSFLSGRYDLVEYGVNPDPETLIEAEYLRFEGDSVNFNEYNFYTIPGPNGVHTAGNEELYTIIGDEFIIDTPYGGVETFDFRIDGDTLYIGDSVWKKAS